MKHVCIPVCVSLCVFVCTLGKGTSTEANHVCQGRGMLNTPHPTAAHLPLTPYPASTPSLHCLSALLSVSRKWQTLFCQRLLIIIAVIVIVVVVAVAVC